MAVYNILGLMSGSSLDGLDVANVQFEFEDGELVEWTLHQATTIPFSEMWVSRLANLQHQNAEIFAKTDVYFGYYIGELVRDFINKNDLKPNYIASHGHTIFHNPDKKFTTQIGNGAAIAAYAGVPTISNFRMQDVAHNGEGAPVAPIIDKYLFPEYDVLLNLGGIVNASVKLSDQYLGFDITGCNQVLNILAHQVELPYDEDGKIACTGEVIPDLFEALNDNIYFKKSIPKSLSNQWVIDHLVQTVLSFEAPLNDSLRTVVEHIAQQTSGAIASAVKEIKEKDQFVAMATGGGAHNSFLMEQIEKQTQKVLPIKWTIPAREIIDFKEAILMALMGTLRVEGIPNTIKATTGADRDTIGGMIALP